MDAVATFGTRALAVIDPTQLHADAVALAAELAGATHACLTLLDAELGELRVAHVVGFPDSVIDRRLPLVSRYVSPEVLHLGVPLMSDDLSTEQRFVVHADCLEQGLRSAMVLPLRARGRTLGTLAVWSQRPAAFRAPELTALVELSNALAGALARREDEERLLQQALEDALTGLPNRARLQLDLEAALGDAASGEVLPVAVVMLDLDGFKLVNDSYGHQVGDELLVHVAARLGRVTGKRYTLTRFGGDQFAVLATNTDEHQALALAQILIGSLDDVVRIDRLGVHVTASMGVAVSRGELGAGELVQAADVALYKAKRGARGSVALYDEGLRTESVAELELVGALRHALEHDELYVLYQPVMDLATNRRVGFEALVRWHRPRGKEIGPDVFVPLAERWGLIGSLGDFVLRQAISDVARCARRGDSVRVNINVSAHQLTDSRFVDRFRQLLDDYDVAATSFAVEVTETALVADLEAARMALTALRELGVGVLLDDFGTGYSSLSLLHAVPLTGIKVDKSFTACLPGDDGAAKIISALLALCDSMDIDAVVEGIETRAQLDHLQLLGATTAQGFLWAPAVELETALALSWVPRRLAVTKATAVR